MQTSNTAREIGTVKCSTTPKAMLYQPSTQGDVFVYYQDI